MHPHTILFAGAYDEMPLFTSPLCESYGFDKNNIGDAWPSVTVMSLSLSLSFALALSLCFLTVSFGNSQLKMIPPSSKSLLRSVEYYTCADGELHLYALAIG